jgi:hypothetical protein
MPEILILDNKNVTMKYYPESKIFHHEMHQFFFGQEFRDVMNKGVEVFRQYGAHKWLSDDRKVSAWAQEDLEWGDKDWFPRVALSGWKYWAIVMPEKAIGQITMKKMVDRYTARGVQTRIFSNAAEAKTWLESCP